MNAKTKKIDDLNLELTLEVKAEDYAEIERKKLADARRKAEFKGFRKGMVPPAMIKKVYGDQILGEAVNEVVGAELQKYIEENKLNILGEPLGSEKQPEIDWKSGNDFTFVFDLGLQPEVKIEVEKTDTVNQYNITPEAKAEEKDEAKAEAEANALKQMAEWRLSADIRKYFIGKADIKLPEEFLKRWLLYANQGKITKEDIEKEFEGFTEDFKWQMIRGALMKQYDLKIEQKDITEAAEAYVAYQYAAYGMKDIPAEIIKETANNIISDRKQVERLIEQVEDDKVMGKIKETITIKTKKISSAKFKELK